MGSMDWTAMLAAAGLESPGYQATLQACRVRAAEKREQELQEIREKRFKALDARAERAAKRRAKGARKRK